MATKAKTVRFPADLVLHFVEEVFLKLGVEAATAHLTARGIWLASLRGVDSHGIRLLPHYIAAVEGGRINPTPSYDYEQTTASTGRLDADHTFGHAAGIVAMRHAVELARAAGSGHVAVRNSTHCGMMAYYGLEACRQDMIGLAYTHSTPKLQSAGGVRPFFGANPICFAAPMLREEPFCFDSSSTTMSANEIRLFAEEGRTLPPHRAADAAGQETQDPTRFEQLLPIGDYKGFGIAFMVDILCGILTGMPGGDEISNMFADSLSERRFLGQFYGALRIDAFQEPDRFKQRLQDLADRLRAEPRRDPEIPLQAPGDPEKAHEDDRSRNGIPIRLVELSRLEEIAQRLGLAPLSR